MFFSCGCHGCVSPPLPWTSHMQMSGRQFFHAALFAHGSWGYHQNRLKKVSSAVNTYIILKEDTQIYVFLSTVELMTSFFEARRNVDVEIKFSGCQVLTIFPFRVRPGSAFVFDVHEYRQVFRQGNCGKREVSTANLTNIFQHCWNRRPLRAPRNRGLQLGPQSKNGTKNICLADRRSETCRQRVVASGSVLVSAPGLQKRGNGTVCRARTRPAGPPSPNHPQVTRRSSQRHSNSSVHLEFVFICFERAGLAEFRKITFLTTANKQKAQAFRNTLQTPSSPRFSSVVQMLGTRCRRPEGGKAGRDQPRRLPRTLLRTTRRRARQTDGVRTVRRQTLGLIW